MSEESKARTWIITGASSGLGLALAEAALEAGERVAGTARRVERFGRLRDGYGERLLAVEHDVRDTVGAATCLIRQLTDDPGSGPCRVGIALPVLAGCARGVFPL